MDASDKQKHINIRIKKKETYEKQKQSIGLLSLTILSISLLF